MKKMNVVVVMVVIWSAVGCRTTIRTQGLTVTAWSSAAAVKTIKGLKAAGVETVPAGANRGPYDAVVEVCRPDIRLNDKGEIQSVPIGTPQAGEALEAIKAVAEQQNTYGAYGFGTGGLLGYGGANGITSPIEGLVINEQVYPVTMTVGPNTVTLGPYGYEPMALPPGEYPVRAVRADDGSFIDEGKIRIGRKVRTVRLLDQSVRTGWFYKIDG